MAIQISSILTWARYFVARNVIPDHAEFPENCYTVNPTINDKVSLWKGDITQLSVDAIVNAANLSLLGGGGVDGAIHKAAGEQLKEECATLNGCNAGEAKLTKGYNLPAKHVIHTVGTMTQNPVDLANSYENSFSLMLHNALRSIAFPCISTGVYGYDPENAAHVALRETRHFLDKNHNKVDRVIFCVFLEEDLKIYEKLMQRYFPTDETLLSAAKTSNLEACPADQLNEDKFEQYKKPGNPQKIKIEDILSKV